MQKLICKAEPDWTKAADNWCREWVEKSRAKSLFLPAGETPVPLYKYWNQNPPAYIKHCELVQIDDVLTGAKAGVFREFLCHHLSSMREQLRFIDQASAVADLCLLGLGLNGHVAFHEPALPDSFFSGCVPLMSKTCHTLGVDEGTWGVTYGAAAFLKCKAILLLVRGEKKREILDRMLNKKDCPASLLLSHPNLTLLTDF